MSTDELGPSVHSEVKTRTVSTHLMTYPEFNEEESVLRAFLIKLFEPTLLLWELVIDLPNVYGLEERVAVGGVGLSNVDKQMFAVLQWTHKKTTRILNTKRKEFLSVNSLLTVDQHYSIYSYYYSYSYSIYSLLSISS